MAKTSITQFKKNKENPFVKQALEQIQNNIVKKYKTATKTGEKAILKAVDENGIELGHTQFIRQIEVDEEQFAKLYLMQFKEFMDLKPQAWRVLGYILNILPINKDTIFFDLEDCKDYTKYKSANSVYTGLASLIKKQVIARGKNSHMFFINPMYVFNGNRLTFAKTYVKKKKGVKIKDPNQLEMFNEKKDD